MKFLGSKLLAKVSLTAVLVFASWTRGAWADSQKAAQFDAAKVDSGSLKRSLNEALLYLKLTQKQETRGIEYFSGEWESEMRSVRDIPLIGPAGTGGYDSNLFTVASIHTLLSGIWKRDPELSSIPPMLTLSTDRILTYQAGNSFNFWPLLPPNLYRSSDPEFERIRRPNHFPIRYKRLEAGCNVYNDADDTAVAFSAIRHAAEILPDSSPQPPSQIGPIFSEYRDQNRPVPHFYNARYRTRNTGAFLTWLHPEQVLRPKSYIPSTRRPYLPFGQNDVDCVVNTNVLHALAQYSELDTPGVEDACEFLHWAFLTGRSRTCGVYYPSPYNAHYTLAKAFQAGASCLKPAALIAAQEILNQQGRDGMWKSRIKGDDIHTSLYALNALLYLRAADLENETGPLTPSIDRALSALLSQKVPHSDGSASWPKGVFFSGGTFARYWIFWTSEPYTTALAADAISLELQTRSNSY
jgi:hypothetical protein